MSTTANYMSTTANYMSKEKFKKILTNLKKKDDKEFALAYLDYLEFKDKEADAALYQYGLPLSIVGKLKGIKDKATVWEEALRDKATKYLAIYDNPETSHTKRKEAVEDAIRLLGNFIAETKNNMSHCTYTLLANAYLLRSKIFRPKGESVPAKKKEAIRKGIEYADKALKKESNNKSAHRVRALLYLEINRLEDENKPHNDEIVKVLKEALENGCTEFSTQAGDIKIAALYTKLNKDTSYLDEIIQSPLPDIELEKARAYKELSQETEFEGEMFKVIDSLKELPFSHPSWDDTVFYLKELWKSKQDLWKKNSLDLSLCLWENCQQKEKTITTPLHIRWHWSRMRDLYDLAFLATNDLLQKVRIADSLKSRPALKWSAWNALAQQDEKHAECYKSILEMEAKSQTGEYIKELNELKGKCDKTGTSSEHVSLSYTAITQGWTVVHFYLNKLEKKGYAIIATNGNDSKEWKLEDFKYNKIFDAYMEWQKNYNNLPNTEKYKSADRLLKLCETIGQEMNFLFDDKIIPEGNKVLFIPHDFLHRLPLHGAIKTNGNGKKTFILENNVIAYLPAWSVIPKKSVLVSEYADINIVFKNFKSTVFDEIEKWEWIMCDSASSDAVIDIDKAPFLLSLICHGIADNVNPFNSRLLFTDPLSYLKLSQSSINIEGSKVFLGACEADLVPSLSSLPDEHLSFPAAFLMKGASEVLGALWIVKDVKVLDLLQKIKETFNMPLNKNLLDALNSWQKAYILVYKNDDDDFSSLFWTLSYRAFSIPV